MNGERVLEALGELERERQAAELEEAPAPALPAAFTARLVADALRETGVAPPVRELVPPRRTPRIGPAILGLGAIAAAAVAAFSFLGAPSLPRYELAVTGGERALRSGAAPAIDAPIRLSAGSALVVELRPDEPAEGPITARAYLYAAGSLAAWDAPVAVSPEGAARIELAVTEAIAGRIADRSELVVVLAPSGARLEAAAIEDQLRSESFAPWLLFRRSIELASPEAGR